MIGKRGHGWLLGIDIDSIAHETVFFFYYHAKVGLEVMLHFVRVRERNVIANASWITRTLYFVTRSVQN